MIDPLLEIGPHVTVLPVVHGSGDFAWQVRRTMMAHDFDCVAVPLPESFQANVENAILQFPSPSIVVQQNAKTDFQTGAQGWSEDSESDEDDELDSAASYVPIDPCQPVITAIRTAMGERIPRVFLDLETADFNAPTRTLPDSYALKQVPIQQFAAAVLPFLTKPENEQWQQRVNYMAMRLRELCIDYKRILLVVSVLDWPWIRQAYFDRSLQTPEHDLVEEVQHFQVNADTLYFLLGELPFVSSLYERARASLESDDNLSIDGVKELLISARKHYRFEYKNRARKVTPRTLAVCLKYIRNLTLIDYGFSPQLSTIVNAAKQVVGDGYALSVLAKAKEYGYETELDLPEIKMGINQASFPDGEVSKMENRLPGPPLMWTRLELIPKPDLRQQEDWQQQWNPRSQCSWPPEDELIENLRQTVFERAQEALGADLARTEKFTSSVKDGIDIRDTIRHWYDGDIYVKVMPPNRGKLDCAVMLFDSPADPREYPWRTTWFAEHKDESTLCFYATDFMDEPVGPGICLANYGGVMFLYPPIAIPDIWSDPRLDFASTLEERLLAAACMYSECPHIALLSPAPPGPAWRRLAKHYKKKFIHLPLGRFGDSTIQQLRMVHVLNGKEVRSFAADFIRRS